MAEAWQTQIQNLIALLETGVWQAAPEPVLTPLEVSSVEQQALVWCLAGLAQEPDIYRRLAQQTRSALDRGLPLAEFFTLMPHVDTARLTALLTPSHVLMRYGFLITPPGELPSITTPLKLHPRLVAAMRQTPFVDAALVAAVQHKPPAREVLMSDAQAREFTRMQTLLREPHPQIVLVKGKAGTGRGWVCRHACAQAGRETINVDGRMLSTVNELAALAALQREQRLTGAAIIIEHAHELWAQLATLPTGVRTLQHLLATRTGPMLLTSDEKFTLAQGAHEVPWPLPDAHTRRALWQRELSMPHQLDAGELDQLAHQYPLGSTAISEAIRTAHAASPPNTPLRAAHLAYGIQANITHGLTELATPITVNQTWAQVVLTDDTMEDVKALLGRARHAHRVMNTWGFAQTMSRGTGTAALFTGPPGTGKTLVAGLLARELGLELYQVDLANVVSKWIGETEKQLAKLFDAAEAGHALLLFDEADALFSKRTVDVRSSNDKYANLEVNFLLQRIERFNGIVVLTTNLDSSLDPALRRRLAAHIHFPQPDEPARRQLWECLLPAQAPRADDLALDKLAKEFREMSGANIRNAVLTAAFLAAEEGAPISQKHLVSAARSEYRAMGRVLGHLRA